VVEREGVREQDGRKGGRGTDTAQKGKSVIGPTALFLTFQIISFPPNTHDKIKTHSFSLSLSLSLSFSLSLSLSLSLSSERLVPAPSSAAHVGWQGGEEEGGSCLYCRR